VYVDVEAVLEALLGLGVVSVVDEAEGELGEEDGDDYEAEYLVAVGDVLGLEFRRSALKIPTLKHE
jgi:hypothetical protein